MELAGIAVLEVRSIGLVKGTPINWDVFLNGTLLPWGSVAVSAQQALEIAQEELNRRATA
jgi:hypothetical protein